jgi:hypothetical protein
MSDDDLVRRGDALEICTRFPYPEGIATAIAALTAVTAPDVAGLVAEGRKVMDGVTAGPWVHEGDTLFGKEYGYTVDLFDLTPYDTNERADQDAAFIVWARNNMDTILAALPAVTAPQGVDAGETGRSVYDRTGFPPVALAPAQPAPDAPDLLSIVERFVALPSGAWHPERHAAEEAELMRDARAILALRKGGDA